MTEHQKADIADCDDTDEAQDLVHELAVLQKKQEKIKHHLRKLENQKPVIWQLRHDVKGRSVVLTMDFISWYLKDMSKINSLSFVIESNPTGQELKHQYLDMPCHDQDTNAHNHYFVATAIRTLSEPSAITAFNVIIFISCTGLFQ